MRLLRPAARVLDAWGALIVGVLVVLAVIILLATPGPWREVVGSSPVVSPGEPPRDVVVFVRGDSEGDECTGVVWLHVERERPALTAVVVPVKLRVAVPGAGFEQVCRVVDVFDPAVATAALAEALDVPLSGWVSLSGAGLKAAVPSMFPAGGTRRERRQRKAAVDAWAGRGSAQAVLRRQTRLLAAALPGVPLETLSVVAVANYALGSDLAESDLDLQQATALAAGAREVLPQDVAVRSLPVIRETRGEGVFWRPRWDATDRLTQSLRLGLRPPESTEAITHAVRPGGVLLVLPSAMDAAAAEAFEDGLTTAVAESAGETIEVTALRCSPGGADAHVAEAVTARGPLAVVLVATDVGDEYDEIVECAHRLRRLYQPAVFVAPVRAAEDGGQVAAPDALEETGLPLVPVTMPAASPAPDAAPAAGVEAAAWAAAGRAAAGAAVRACWPEVLAPDLAGTRLGVSYAERRTVDLSIAAGDGAPGTRGWLLACGYVPVLAASDWAPPSALVRVAYQRGWRRLALAVAGDLVAPPSQVVVDETAPAPVTVIP